MGEGWTAFRLQRLGQWNEANTRTFPLTTEIIRGLNIPLAVRGVMFAKQVQPFPSIMITLIAILTSRRADVCVLNAG